MSYVNKGFRSFAILSTFSGVLSSTIGYVELYQWLFKWTVSLLINENVSLFFNDKTMLLLHKIIVLTENKTLSKVVSFNKKIP